MSERRIDRDEVLRIAALANLELDDDAIERMTRELGAIVAYVAQLQELDVEGVPATAQLLTLLGEIASLPLREDLPEDSLPRDTALGEAPETAMNGFAVPAFVDEG